MGGHDRQTDRFNFNFCLTSAFSTAPNRSSTDRLCAPVPFYARASVRSHRVRGMNVESPAYYGRMCGRAGRGLGNPDPAPEKAASRERDAWRCKGGVVVRSCFHVARGASHRARREEEAESSWPRLLGSASWGGTSAPSRYRAGGGGVGGGSSWAGCKEPLLR